MKFTAVRAIAIALSLAVPCHSEFITLTRRPTLESKLPTNISTITAEDIRRSGAVNVAEAIQVVPGVDLQRSGSIGSLTSARIRGIPSSNSVQVIVDDQPVGGVSIQDINLALIPVENIDRIEIVRGASSNLYGANTTGGVIHIITKKTTGAPSAEVGAQAQSFKTSITTAKAGGSFGPWDVLGTGIGYKSDGYMQNSDIDSQTGTGTFGYRLANGGRIEAATIFINHEGGTPNGTPHKFEEWNGHIEREPNSQTQRIDNEMWRNRVTLETPAFSRVQVKTSVYHQHESYQFFNQPVVPFFDDSWFKNTIAGADTRVTGDEGTTIGASYERDAREASGQASHHVINLAAYAEQEVNIFRLTLLPALRYDHHSSFGGEVNPRLAAVYRVSERWKVSASAARSFRAPTMVDLYIRATDPFFPAFDFFGNPNVKPEKAWAYDVGTRFSPIEWLETGVSGFYTRITDRITAVDTDGNGNVDTVANVSEAEVSGLEVDASATTGAFHHRASYTFQRSVGTSPGFDGFVELRLTPRHIANYRLLWDAPGRLEVINTIEYVGRQFESDNQTGTVLAPYAVWNARLERPFGRVRIFAGVNNIANRLYAESITFGNPVPQPTRVYYGGVTLRIGGHVLAAAQ